MTATKKLSAKKASILKVKGRTATRAIAPVIARAEKVVVSHARDISHEERTSMIRQALVKLAKRGGSLREILALMPKWRVADATDTKGDGRAVRPVFHSLRKAAVRAFAKYEGGRYYFAKQGTVGAFPSTPRTVVQAAPVKPIKKGKK